jgi:hypothetical protein
MATLAVLLKEKVLPPFNIYICIGIVFHFIPPVQTVDNKPHLQTTDNNCRKVLRVDTPRVRLSKSEVIYLILMT